MKTMISAVSYSNQLAIFQCHNVHIPVGAAEIGTSIADSAVFSPDENGDTSKIRVTN